MNKFLNRNVKPSAVKDKTLSAIQYGKANNIIEECEAAWNSLETARAKLRRSVMYAYEDQWGDYVKDPETDLSITEGDLIKKQGKTPLKSNMIAPIIKNIEGQFRNNVTDTVCSVRDQSEAKIGEMMSIAMEYVHDNNEIDELDADTLRLRLLGGYAGQRIEYGWNPTKRMNDVWVYGINPARLFFNTNVEDVRTWDINLVGEIYDMKLSNVVSLFAKSKADKKWIEDIYGRQNDMSSYIAEIGLQGEQTRNIDFYQPTRPDMCRVIFVWKLETREAYFCHDYLKGTWFYEDVKNKAAIDAENNRRLQEAAANGMETEDVLLIEYEYKNELYWYYRYLTPFGDVLQEGRSPYWHEGPNIVIDINTLVQGKVFNFVEDFIDQNRVINRTMMLIDFIRSAGAKGMLVVDEDSLESMTREEVVDEWVRYNGVIFVKLKNGKRAADVISQFNGAGALTSDFELLNLQLKLINDIAGVNSAMQGKSAPSGTAASLYAQQVQNSSLNLKGMFESFKAFRRRRDVKLMQTIQQYYDSARYIDTAGKNYSEESKYYNPEKVQNALLDLKLTDGSNTPSFQMLENDFLMNLFEKNAIDVKTMLENTSYPFASSILESIKRKEEEMRQQQSQQQPSSGSAITPDMMQQYAANPQLMQKMNNDANMQAGDGTVNRVA